MADGEITISELELSEELLADMVIPVETSTDTKSATLAQLRSWLGTSLPIGSIFASVGKIDDARFTLLDGKTLSSTGTYAEFYLKAVEKVQAGKWQSCSEEEFNLDVSKYGQCGKFVITNDYVRIPKLTRFIGATNNIAEVGNSYGESLPNLKGSYMPKNSDYFCASNSGSIATGIFKTRNYGTKGYNIQNTGNQNYDQWILEADASEYSATYKDGAKVQPDHTKYFYYMVISTEGQTEPVDIDINQVYEDMELKANKDFSNIDANIDYVVESYQNGSSWYRVYKSGWVEQGGVINNVGTTTTTYFTKKYASNPSVLVTELYNVNTTNQTIINQIFNDRFVIHNDHTQKVASAVWEAKGQGE